MPENGLLMSFGWGWGGGGGCLHAWTPPHPLWSAYTRKLHNSNTVQRRGLGTPSLDLPLQQLARFWPCSMHVLHKITPPIKGGKFLYTLRKISPPFKGRFCIPCEKNFSDYRGVSYPTQYPSQNRAEMTSIGVCYFLACIPLYRDISHWSMQNLSHK